MSRLLRIGLDATLVLLATVAAILLQTDLDLSSPDLARHLPYLAVTAALAPAAIVGTKLDAGIWRYASLRDVLVALAVALVTAAGSTMALFAYNRLDGIARTVPVLQGVLTVVVLLAPRLVARCAAGLRERPAPFSRPAPGAHAERNVLVVGYNALSDLYARSVADAGNLGVRIVGIVGLTPRQAGRHVGQVPVLGIVEELPRIVADLAIHGVRTDRIVFMVSPGSLSARAREAVVAVGSDHGIPFEFLPERLIGAGTAEGGEDAAGAHPFAGAQDRAAARAACVFEDGELQRMARSPYWRAKRGLDIGGALTLLAILAPFGLLAAILTALDGGFPLVFRQERVGLGGAPFRLLKLRTMSAAHDRHGRRVADGDRTSRIGALLRRLRLDELPQLLNVLAGDMSLIGPRPLLAADQPAFESGRLLVRPGLTGWAQVCGGRIIGASTKAALDAWYIRNASLTLDLRILIATGRVLLVGERLDASRIERARAELHRCGLPRASGGFQPIGTLPIHP